MIYHCAEEKIKAALKSVMEVNEFFQPETLEDLRQHFETLRRALLFTQRAMGEPSDGMKEAAWGMPDIEFGEIPEANWKYMAAKLWEETDEV